ncbi:IBR domain, a half RING-finger domain-containing protein [Trichoderma breve]|uniref:RBR-type E3 ubiquitin transferase n=1 Tax=Trichoderma breve TaxID=2034170 RepID=A0A9W9B4Q6_9HYPO|nr:IBR domain, a half RING-finger domain-containing protein [Trichoderma breve]KAJ4856238.1 IBR domain, a half RING-finger domain-containing protein [Trichoderma breve]
MDHSAVDDDDVRATELETLEAIYPELRRPDGAGFVFELELPVEPAAPVTVTFPAAAEPGQVLNGSASDAPALVDSLQVSHLPPLTMHITLPDGYPAECAPLVKISTTPQWLSAEKLASLAGEASQLWEEMGRDLVAYTYIDHIQRAADDVFGAITSEGTLQVDPEHKLAVLDYDIKAKKAAFDKETFNCGICLDPKKGSKCHKMLDCTHIFCLQCLQDFYNDAIKEGNLSTVRCLAPNCAKERSAAAKEEGEKRRKPKTFISPSELLQIGLSEEMVKRYVDLKYKTELESDKNTIYCPRQWCNGADEKSEANGKSKKGAEKFNRGDLLSVCEDCGFAFCSRCYQSWHGEFFQCAPRRKDGELTEDDKASLEYLKLHTSPCPTCNAPAQKTHGCNHMICSRCDTHFCYLCSCWLDPGNPYRHYNQQEDGKVTSCYMRLWELEGGDGDDVAVPEGEEALNEIGLEIEEMDDEVEGNVDANANANANVPVQLDENGQRVAVAREAPLVLRLMDNPVNNGNNNNNNQGRGGHRGADNLPARARGGGAARGRAAAHGPNHRGGQAANNARGHPANRARGARGDARRGQDGGRGGARGRAGAAGRGGAARQNPDPNDNNNQNQDGLDADQEAWVRHFVRMALLDAEDEVEGGDSDEEDENWRFR